MQSHIPQRMGTKHPNIAPYGDIFYGSDDKAIVLAVGTEAQFQRLCDWLSKSEWYQQEAYATNAARVRNRDALNALLKSALDKFSASHIVEELTKVAVPVALIRDMKSVFESPLAQQMILEQKEEDGNVSRRVRTVAFSEDV
jgi:crotonobetainyl-CoA:carnitine CoA-transferase CaiB-like acyl-CoA transferase